MNNQKGSIARAFLIIAIGFLLFVFVSNSFDFKSKIFSAFFHKSLLYAAGIRGQSGDGWSDIVIGKPDFSEITPNTVVPNKVFEPHSVIVDRYSNPNKLYVYDGSNSRILGFDLQKCLSFTNNPLNCTADLIIGQPNGNTSACNGDGGFQNYPTRAPASASTFCGLQESQLSVAEGGSAASMYVDSQGNLYVTDFWNNRVLKYNSPFSTDKTGGKGDNIVDDVWGQTDMTGQNCNKGGSADATTLCLSPWSGNNNWTAGVDIDIQGNLWVADSNNNRVLRFPGGSKTADLILGQSTFSATAAGSGLNQFNGPAAVRITSQGVYVADEGNNRVLLFTGPLSSGMNGALFGANFSVPSGVDVDPTEAGVWVANRGHSTFELWSEGTLSAMIKTLGARDNGNVLNNPTGSLGIDSAGNYFVAVPQGNYGDDVVMIPASGPFNLPSKQLFGGNNTFNQRDAKSINSGNGVAIYEGLTASQMIVLDGSRIEFWNNINSLSNGKSADGMAEITDFSSTSLNGGFTVIKASKNNLYVGRTKHNLPARIEIYSLPLTNGAQFTKYISLPLNDMEGNQINFPSNIDPHMWGVLPTGDDQFLWVADSDNSRVFRIRGPLTANPVVDVVLGQTSVTGVSCNQGGAYTGGNADTAATNLCDPGFLSFDKLGNLYVSDHSLEIRGNMRLLEFNSSLFPTNNTSTIFDPAASKIFPRIATWEPSFDSQNRMVVGFNPYWTPDPKGGWFIGVYNNPLATTTTPDSFLNDYYSMGFTTAFDSHDNLYVGDLDRAKVLIYLHPFNNPQSSSSPTPSPTPTPTPTPSGFSVSGIVYVDFNQSKVLDPGEPGWAGVKVTLNGPSGINLSTNTGVSGYYSFNPAVTGNYYISVNQPSGFGTTSPNNVSLTFPPSAIVNFGLKDSTKPTVSIFSPINNSRVLHNSTVNISASASDNVGVAKVTFYVQNTLLCTDIIAPYTCSWSVPSQKGQNYNITVYAYDATGNNKYTSIKVKSY